MTRLNKVVECAESNHKAQIPKLWLWQEWARSAPNATALRCGSLTLNWRELNQEIARYRALLVRSGVREGDVLTIVGTNTVASVLYYLAALELGMTTAFVMPAPAELVAQKLTTLYSSHETVFVADLNFESNFEPRGDFAAVCHLPLASDWEQQNAFVRGVADPDVSLRVDVDIDVDTGRLASLIFTSGSTGTPKAVAHTLEQHMASAQGLLERLKFGQEDSWLLSLPLYHVSGLAIVHRWLVAGATLKLVEASLFDDLAGVTHASLVPVQLQRLLASGVPLALTHVLLGGSHIPLELATQAATLGIETWVGYGLTEAASTVVAKCLNHSEDQQNSSVGSVLPKRAIQLIDGHIWIGGETLASGYYHQGTLKPLANAAGWFDSRDLGTICNHELTIIGRADNQFISGGENIHCEEIEAALLQHPTITQAFIVPIVDADYGARPLALIEGGPLLVSNQYDAVALAHWLAPRLVRFKHPEHYYPLPQSQDANTVKISRAALKEWVATHTNFQPA